MNDRTREALEEQVKFWQGQAKDLLNIVCGAEHTEVDVRATIEAFRSLTKAQQNLREYSATHPERQRNLNATCSNCPYGFPWREGVACRRNAYVTMSFDETLNTTTWCGDHPAFWKEA